MKVKKAILAISAAGCLATTLYAAQSRADNWCRWTAWWNQTIDYTCVMPEGNVRAKGRGDAWPNGTKMVWSDLVPAEPAPAGGKRYAWIRGRDLAGNYVAGCEATDYNVEEGQTAADGDGGCESAASTLLQMGYYYIIN